MGNWVRFSAGEQFEGTVTLGATTDIDVPAGEDLVIRLGDAVGANLFILEDSAGTDVFWVDSDGSVIIRDASNDGNPQVRVGATDAEEVHVQAVYDAGAQTLDYVLFTTDVASATADKGEYRFNVDGTVTAIIDDGGLELASGGTIDWAGDIVLTHSTDLLTLSGGAFAVTNAGGTTGSSALTVTQGAHTAITANQPSINIPTASLGIGTGSTIAIGSWVHVAAPTYTGVAGGGAETISDAATVYIDAAPVQGANAALTRTYALWADAGPVRFDDNIQWGAGVAVTAANYSVGRDADGTNQLHFNVPTGATFEFSINDATEMTLSATAVDFQNNTITTTGGGSLTGTWSDLGTVTTIDINGGTIDGTTIGATSATTIVGSNVTIKSATPSLDFKDSDASAGDVNAQILAAATDAGNGTEDIDVTFYQQIAGVATAFLTADADGNITFGSTRPLVANGGGSLTGTWTDLGTVTTVDINGGTIDGVTIGGTGAGAVTGTTITATSFVIGANTLTTAEWAFLDGQNQAVATTSSPTFANLTITSFAADWTNAGRTVADLGIVTTADVNGGTLDNVSIGASTASTAIFTTFGINPSAAGTKTMTAGTQYTGNLAGNVQTTDATATTLVTITLDTDQSVTCQAIVSAVLSDGSKGFHAVIAYGARKDGAAAAAEVLANSELAKANSDASVFAACAFEVSGDTVLLRVTGEASSTIKWTANVGYSVADI